MTAPDEYARRLLTHQATVAAFTRLDARAAWLRLATFGALVLLAWLAWSGSVRWWWLALPAAAFAALMRWHDTILTGLGRARRLVAFYERGLARIGDRWSGTGADGERFLSPGHLYAADLDLFGNGSLFQLLSLARTRAGEDTLAGWLLTPTESSAVPERQAAVRELSEALDLRENMWTAGAEVGASVHPDTLIAWAEAPPSFPRWLQPVGAALTAAVLGAASVAFSTGRYAPLLTALTLAVAVLYRYFDAVSRVLHGAGSWSRDLDVLAGILTHLERAQFESPLLRALLGRMGSRGVAPGIAIARLHRLSEMHDWQHNVLFAAIATPLLWGVHIALAMERWRVAHGPCVRTWLAVVGEFEALGSIAAYRYERPDTVFPEIATGTEASFQGRQLAHPLLPSTLVVANDVDLGSTRQLMVVSGSNMSGKSTLLRTIGVNAVLALMGAPVRAASLSLSPLAIGATLRIQDSLQEGRSRFFAEITRLKAIADQSRQPPPTLFLLDELFHGTNSHDRLRGASGVLRALLDRGAIGLITTHDMALVAVADELAPRAINVHFEDHFDDGEIRFDYKMKAGPVTSSNAIALMRSVGLDVDRP